jgi:hypothetical protein
MHLCNTRRAIEPFFKKWCSTRTYARQDFPAFKLLALPDCFRGRTILYVYYSPGIQGPREFGPCAAG